MEKNSFGEITQEVINIFGKDLTQDLMKELVKRNKVATGNLSNSFTFELKNFVTSFQLQISALNYEQFVEQGRKSGTYPPIHAIRDWVQVKGIGNGVKGIEYAIQKSIYKAGIKPTNYIDEFITGGKIGDYASDAEKNYSYKLNNYVESIIKMAENEGNNPDK